MTDTSKDHGRRFAVYSPTGVHIGLWRDGKVAADVQAETVGNTVEELVPATERDALVHDLERLKESETDAINRAETAERQRDYVAARLVEAEEKIAAYEAMHEATQKDSGPSVMRRQMELRRYKVRADKAERQRDAAIEALEGIANAPVSSAQWMRDHARYALQTIKETPNDQA